MASTYQCQPAMLRSSQKRVTSSLEGATSCLLIAHSRCTCRESAVVVRLQMTHRLPCRAVSVVPAVCSTRSYSIFSGCSLYTACSSIQRRSSYWQAVCPGSQSGPTQSPCRSRCACCAAALADTQAGPGYLKVHIDKRSWNNPLHSCLPFAPLVPRLDGKTRCQRHFTQKL